MSGAHDWRERPPGTRRVERNVSGTSPTHFEAAIPAWCYCARCGCSRVAAERFGWACETKEREP